MEKPLTAAKVIGLLPPQSESAAEPEALDIDRHLLVHRAATPREEITTLMNALTVPARIVDKGGVVLNCNRFWTWDMYRPQPKDDDDGREFLMPIPGENNKERLGEFRLAQTRDRQGTWLQIAINIDHRLSGGKEVVLNGLWRLVSGIGFTRMQVWRRFRVPGSGGLLKRVGLYSSNQTNGKSDISSDISDEPGQPINGPNEIRFAEYDLRKWPRRFVFNILPASAADEYLQTESLWASLLGFKQGQTWFEFPVLCIQDGNDTLRARLLITVDKIASNGSAITREDVEKRAVSLRLHCIKLSDMLNDEIRAAVQRSREAARLFFTGLRPAEDGGFEKIQHEFAQHACKMAEAEVAVLAWKLPGQQDLLVQAVAVEPAALPDFQEVYKLQGRPVRADYLPAMAKTFEDHQSHFDADGDPSVIDLRRYFLRFCRVSLPLKVGNKLVGIIGLCHRTQRHFTLRRIEAVMALLELAAQLIDNVVDAKTRRQQWETSLFHEVKTQAGAAIVAVRKAKSARASPDDLTRAAWWLELMIDRANAYFRLASGRDLSASAELDPSPVLTEELARASGMQSVYGKKITEHRKLHAWSGTVRAERAGFGYVLRTLLENAFHHGEGEEIQVTEGVEICDSQTFWTLEVINGGQMTEMEDRLKFTPFVRPPRRRRDGSHVGLAAALDWARTSNADISLENQACGNLPTVVARLRWPAKARWGVSGC